MLLFLPWWLGPLLRVVLPAALTLLLRRPVELRAVQVSSDNITVEGFKIHNAVGFSFSKFAGVDRLIVEPDWSALFWEHKLRLRSVRLEHPEFYLEIDADKRKNIPRSGRKKDKPSSTSPQQLLNRVFLLAEVDRLSISKGVYGMRLQRQDLELMAPEINLEAERGSASSFRVRRIQAPNVHLRVGGRLDVEGTILLREGRATPLGSTARSLAIEFKDHSRIEALDPVLTDYTDPRLEMDPRATIDLLDVTRVLHLPLALEGVATLAGQVRGLARELSVSASLEAPTFQARGADPRLKGDAARISGQLELQGTTITARNLHFRAFGGETHLDGTLELERERRGFRAQLLQKDGELLPLLRQLRLPIELQALWSGQAEIESQGFGKEGLRIRGKVYFQPKGSMQLKDYRPELSAEAPPEARKAITLPAEASAAPSELRLDEALRLAYQLMDQEALHRAERGEEERFAPRPIRKLRLGDLRGQALPIQGSIDFSVGGGEVALEDAALLAPGSKIAGYGKIGLDKTYDVQFTAQGEELGVLCYALRPFFLAQGIDAFPWTIGQGQGLVRGHLKGAPRMPVLDLAFWIKNGLYQSFAFELLQGQMRLVDKDLVVQAVLKDGDSSMQATAHMITSAKGNLQAIRSPLLDLSWLSLLPDMDLLLETEQYSLPRWLDQLGWDLPGRLSFRGKAHAYKAGEQLHSELNVEIREPGYLVGQKIEDLDMTLHLDNGKLRIMNFRGLLNGSPLTLGGTAEAPRRLELDLDLGPLQLAPVLKLFKVPVPISGKADIVLAVEGELPAPLLRFSLKTQDLSIQGLAAPPGEIQLDLAIRGSQLLVLGKFFGDSLSVIGTIGLWPPFECDLEIQFHQAQLASLLGLVSATLAEFVGGELEGQFHLSGPLLTPGSLRLDGSFSKARLQLTEILVENQQPVQLVLQDGVFQLLPSEFLGTGGSFLTQASYRVGGLFELATRGDANLLILKAFDRSGLIDSVTGKAALDIQVRVEPDRPPSITGTAKLSEGYLKLTTLLQSIAPISGTIVLNYPLLSVRSDAPLQAVFGGGEVRLWGTVAAPSARLEEIALELWASGSRLNFHYLPDLDLELSPEVQVQGTAAVPQVSGSIVFDQARYHGRIELKPMLIQAAEQTTGTLLSSRPQLTPQEIEASTVDPVLDLDLKFPNLIRIESKGVEMKLSASSLRAVGTYLRMGLLGILNVEPEGSIAYEDREFDVTHGTLEFFDPTRLEPNVNLGLHGQVGEYDININVSGTASNTHTQFLSSPALPELNILSLILGGLPETILNPTTGLVENRARGTEQLVGAAASALALDETVFRRVGNILAADRFLVDPVITESGFQGARLTWGKTIGKLDIVASQVLPATKPPLILFKYKLVNGIFIEGRNQGGRLQDTDVELKFRWEFQ